MERDKVNPAPAAAAVGEDRLRPARHGRALGTARSDRLPLSFIAALSAGQVVSWGSVVYAFTLFIAPMAAELGWSKTELTAAYSLGLATSAFGAMPAGRLVDLGSGRLVMALGSGLAAGLLLAWSRVEAYASFLAIWAGLGLALSAILYEPAFAVIARSLGPLARRGITATTLVGGFASTVFIPLTHLLIERLGWREALVALAAMNFGCVLLHLAILPSRRASAPAASVGTRPGAAAGPRRVLGLRGFWGFVAVSVLHNALLSAALVQLIPLLTERGFALDALVAAFAVIGPAQVAARIVVAASERRLSLRSIGVATTLIPVAAFSMLPWLSPGSWLIGLFAALFGAANGMMTIVRAVLPAELFGRADYGAIQGMIAAPSTLAKALGPFALAAVWAGAGGGAALMLFIAVAAASAVAYLVLVLPGR